MFAFFQDFGNCPEIIRRLKNLLKGKDNWFAPSLSKRGLIKSVSDALDKFNDFKILRMSFAVILI